MVSISTGLSVSEDEEEREAKKSLFSLIDSDRDGVIGVEEWKHAFDLIDDNRDGAISRKEWYRHRGETCIFDSINRRHRALVSRSEWEKAFEDFDVDGSGSVSLEEWQNQGSRLALVTQQERASLTPFHADGKDKRWDEILKSPSHKRKAVQAPATATSIVSPAPSRLLQKNGAQHDSSVSGAALSTLRSNPTPDPDGQYKIDLSSFDALICRLETSAAKYVPPTPAASHASAGCAPTLSLCSDAFAIDLRGFEALVARIEASAERLEKAGRLGK